MPKDNYIEYSSTCSKGINQNEERLLPQQCSDALNVWAPNGEVVQRPGYQGLEYRQITDALSSVIYNGVVIVEDVSGGTFDVAAAPPYAPLFFPYTIPVDYRDVGDRIYLGTDSNSLPTFGLSCSVVNSNSTRGFWEYWNGSTWVYLPVTAYSYTLNSVAISDDEPFVQKFMFETDNFTWFSFVPPADWKKTTIEGLEKYFLRATYKDAALSGGVVLSNFGTIDTKEDPTVCGVFAVQYKKSKQYISAEIVYRDSDKPDPSEFYHFNTYIASTLRITRGYYGAEAQENWISRRVPAKQYTPTVAVVASAEETYMAFAGVVTRHPKDIESVLVTPAQYDHTAHVEDRDFAVGPGAPYDKNSIAQLAAFPKAKFISFFQERLWVVDEDDILRWSAPAPYHRVWPALAYAPMIEDDNSPVSGMYPFGESQVIFKNDSIWVAAYSHIDDFSIPHFVPRKMVSGTGVVANGSIKAIPDWGLVGLSENGLIAFNGVQVRQPSLDPATNVDRLEEFWPRISIGHRRYAAAAHWKTRHTYLLSVALDGAGQNSHVLAWDYVNNAFWIWDNIPAEFWLEDEDTLDNEALYFGDSSGRIYRFGVGDHDHGAAIDSHVERRFGLYDKYRKKLREVVVKGKNVSDDVTVQTAVDGKPVTHGKSSAVVMRDAVIEKGYGTKKFGENFDFIMDRKRTTKRKQIGETASVRVSKSERGAPLRLSRLTARFLPFKNR